MQIDHEILKELKKPQGILIPNKEISLETLRKYLALGKKIIAVGDRTANNRKKRDDLSIKDALASLLPDKKPVVLKAQNPRGTISFDSMSKIKKTLKITNHVVLEINGEEDLLVLPYVLLAESGSIIFYGQPLKGMVVVKVTNAIRQKAKRLIGKFESD